MKSPHTSLGIEMNDNSIKLAEMRFGAGQSPEICKVMSEPIPQGIIDDGKINDPIKLIVTLQGLVARFEPRSKNVHMVIPSQSVMVRFMKFPDVPVKDLAKIIEFEMKHSIHLPFEDPTYDFIKLNESETNKSVRTIYPRKKKSSSLASPSMQELEAAAAKEAGNADPFRNWDTASDQEKAAPQCDVMLIAASKSFLAQYTDVIEAAGLKPVSAEIKALSLFRLVQSSGIVDPNSTFLLVEIGHGATDLSIFHEGQLKITRNVTIRFQTEAGSNHAPTSARDSNPLIGGLFADFEQEEPDPNPDIRNGCNELAHELERLMNFYRYTLNNRDHDLSRIVLSGDITNIDMAADIMNERLNAQRIILLRADFRGEAFSEGQSVYPHYNVPIGLALRGYGG